MGVGFPEKNRQIERFRERQKQSETETDKTETERLKK